MRKQAVMSARGGVVDHGDIAAAVALHAVLMWGATEGYCRTLACVHRATLVMNPVSPSEFELK